MLPPLPSPVIIQSLNRNFHDNPLICEHRTSSYGYNTATKLRAGKKCLDFFILQIASCHNSVNPAALEGPAPRSLLLWTKEMVTRPKMGCSLLFSDLCLSPVPFFLLRDTHETLLKTEGLHPIPSLLLCTDLD